MLGIILSRKYCIVFVVDSCDTHQRTMKDVIQRDAGGASALPGGVAYKASSNTHAPLRGDLYTLSVSGADGCALSVVVASVVACSVGGGFRFSSKDVSLFL